MSTTGTRNTTPRAVPRTLRRLRPDVAAEMRARTEASRMRELYGKRVTELSPGELSVMKAAFFRNRWSDER